MGDVLDRLVGVLRIRLVVHREEHACDRLDEERRQRRCAERLHPVDVVRNVAEEEVLDAADEARALLDPVERQQSRLLELSACVPTWACTSAPSSDPASFLGCEEQARRGRKERHCPRTTCGAAHRTRGNWIEVLEGALNAPAPGSGRASAPSRRRARRARPMCSAGSSRPPPCLRQCPTRVEHAEDEIAVHDRVRVPVERANRRARDAVALGVVGAAVARAAEAGDRRPASAAPPARWLRLQFFDWPRSGPPGWTGQPRCAQRL